MAYHGIPHLLDRPALHFLWNPDFLFILSSQSGAAAGMRHGLGVHHSPFLAVGDSAVALGAAFRLPSPTPIWGAHNGGKEFWAFVDYNGAGLTAISVYRNEM